MVVKKCRNNNSFFQCFKLCGEGQIFFAFVKYNESELLENEMKNSDVQNISPNLFVIWFSRFKITLSNLYNSSKCVLP